MTSNAFDVQIPATEVQIAEAIAVSDPETADTMRRLAFERDQLRAQSTPKRRIEGEMAKHDQRREWGEGHGCGDFGEWLLDRYLVQQDVVCQLIGLLRRCYDVGHRDGWQDGETTNECMDDVRYTLDQYAPGADLDAPR